MKLSDKRNPKESVLNARELIKVNGTTWTLPKKMYVYQNALANAKLGNNFNLPNTFVGIGMSAFADNDHLIKWKVEKDSQLKVIASSAFAGCVHMKEVDIPASVEEIGSYAFKNCESLEKLVLPEGLKQLGEGFAEGCYRLKEITCGLDVLPIIQKQRRQIADLRRITVVQNGKVVDKSEYELRNSMANLYVRKEAYSKLLHDYDEGYDREAAEKNDDFVK